MKTIRRFNLGTSGLLLWTLPLAAQAPQDALWNRIDSNGSRAWYAMETLGSTIYCAGEVTDSLGSQRASLQAFDLNSELLWEHSYFGGMESSARSLSHRANGEFLLCGDLWNNELEQWQLFWMRLSATGDSLQSGVLTGSTSGNGRSICDLSNTSAGGFAVAGSLDDQFALLRYDSSGDTLWTRRWQPYSEWQGMAYSVLQSQDDSLVVAGQLYLDDFEWTSRYHLLLKTDLQGNTLWTAERYDARLFALREGANGNLYCTGEYQDAYLPLHCYSSRGEELWYEQFATPSQNMLAHDLRILDNGDLLLAGRWNTAPGAMDAFLLRTDALGQLDWMEHYDVCGTDVARCLAIGPEELMLLGGNCTPSHSSFLMAFDQTTSIKENPALLPEALVLKTSPNPFNGRTIVRVTLQKAGQLDLSLYNIRGQRLEQIHHALLTQGTHRFVLETAPMASSLLFLRATQGTNSTTIPLLFVQ